MNQGCWTYVRPRIESAMKFAGQSKRANVEFVGRGPSGASATGHHDEHDKELEALLTEAFL
jgi:2-oxoglutarate dehydrogenase E1 component